MTAIHLLIVTDVGNCIIICCKIMRNRQSPIIELRDLYLKKKQVHDAAKFTTNMFKDSNSAYLMLKNDPK